MTWISLVCLLALSNSASGRSISYQKDGSVQPQVSVINLVHDLPEQQPFQNDSVLSYDAQEIINKPLIQADVDHGKNQGNVQNSTNVTKADILCRGQSSETGIPLDNGRRFVVCLYDGIGYEESCPGDLYYVNKSRRCERKSDPLKNPCSSQPCLNAGQCVANDTSYQCQCLPGVDGTTCELDVTVCQTQQPCGLSSDAKCQSFRFGAALQYICILDNGRAYGLTASQAQPSPCNGVDGTFPLVFSDKGFIMCDGESMFVESCPGGTIWDDRNKACTWPDLLADISPDEKRSELQSVDQSINSTQSSSSGETKTPTSQILPQQKTLEFVQPQQQHKDEGNNRQINFTIQ